MSFMEVLEHLKAGRKVRREEWKGYWVMEGNELIMHCVDSANPDGALVPLNIKDTPDIIYTLTNVASNDWVVVD